MVNKSIFRSLNSLDFLLITSAFLALTLQNMSMNVGALSFVSSSNTTGKIIIEYCFIKKISENEWC